MSSNHLRTGDITIVSDSVLKLLALPPAELTIISLARLRPAAIAQMEIVEIHTPESAKHIAGIVNDPSGGPYPVHSRRAFCGLENSAALDRN